jgi:hypothetical protein
MESIELSPDEAGTLAIDFLMAEWGLSPEDQEWFVVLSARLTGPSWFIVEIGVEGLPDKWIIQVYDTRECDPSYTFKSPIAATVGNNDLDDLPEAIATVLASERSTT